MFNIIKAERKKAKLRIALCGVSGSGKTYSSLLIANGLGGKICVIDTESKSAHLYAKEFDYDVLELGAPYTPERYVGAIKAVEKAAYDTIIIDSLTHAWAGEGGALDMVSDVTKADPRANSYTAWRKVTPEHNKLVDAMLASKCHIIATMRSKADYVTKENEKGKSVPVKVGLAPIQRDGMDYEFTAVLDISTEHYAVSSKDRTHLFDGKNFKISAQTGEDLKEWLNEGKDENEEEAQMITLFEHYKEKIKNEQDIDVAKKIAREAWGDLKKSELYQHKIKVLVDERTKQQMPIN